MNRQLLELPRFTIFSRRGEGCPPGKPYHLYPEFTDLNHVNGRWRKFLKSYPEFWTRLDCTTKHNTAVSIKNAQNLPLEIVIDSSQYYEKKGLDLALQYIGRILSITVKNSPSLPIFLEKHFSELSSLRTLCLLVSVVTSIKRTESHYILFQGLDSIGLSEFLNLLQGTPKLENIELSYQMLEVGRPELVHQRVSLESLTKLTICADDANSSLILLNYLDISSPASISFKGLNFCKGCSFPFFTVTNSSYFTLAYLKFTSRHTKVLLSGPHGTFFAEGEAKRYGITYPEKDRIREFLDHFVLRGVEELGVKGVSETVDLPDILRPMKGLTTIFLNGCECTSLVRTLSAIIHEGLCREVVLYTNTPIITYEGVSEIIANLVRKLDLMVVLGGPRVLREHFDLFQRLETISDRFTCESTTEKYDWDCIPRHNYCAPSHKCMDT